MPAGAAFPLAGRGGYAMPAVPESFHDKLHNSWRKSDSALCVGLDPRLDRLPGDCLREPWPLRAFCRRIVDATADLVCAYKIQIACFSAVRAERELESLIGYLRRAVPDVPVILDAKRGDIGATAELYARELFEVYDADAATINPYLGWDSIEPYRQWPGRGVILVCRTSNPDSAWLQDQPPRSPVYLRVAEQAAARDRGDLMLVVGATFPKQMAAVRDRAPELPLLVPGVGAQGGDLGGIFASGATRDGLGLVISASRSVIFAGGDGSPAAVRQAATTLRDDMRRLRDAALAGR